MFYAVKNREDYSYETKFLLHKKENIDCEMQFLFFFISELQKMLLSLKNKKIMDFESIRTFFA